MEEETAQEDIDGSIRSIHVRNFFCHENLEINLNRNVNFIVGRNGSGKSAILTALVVGLGSRASATNRGNNLHSFIKKGANSATIEIKIKNSSPKAYKHDVYGDYITVVRTINASGGSAYKVKSASGEIKSTKFEEVNSIILAHDIQVDNPISVLNQDDARSFHASDAKKKYSLFRKATNLDQTETCYNRALENCHKATSIWKRKTDACAELEKEYKKWKTSHEQLQSRDEIQAKNQALQNEYYWSEIAEFERDAARVQEQYDKHNAKIQKLVEKLSNMEQNFGSNSDTIDRLKSELDDKRLEKTALDQELGELGRSARDLQATWRSAQAAFGKHRELLARERRKVADLEREIQNIDSGTAASQREELERRAAVAKEAAAAARARYDTAHHHAAQARAHAQRAAAQLDQAGERTAAHRNKLKQLKQQLRELESRGDDSLGVYGAHMAELVQRVAQLAASGHFSMPPRGPVGSFIKLKEKRWGGALEHIIGGSIQTFCVNEPDDTRKLFKVMDKIYGNAVKPAVTCSKFLRRQHDVRRNKVHAAGFVCALDAVDVTDPDVANYLIDNVGLERVLLVPSQEDAIRLTETEENVPENCSKVVTLDSSEYYPAPNYRSYGGAGKHSRFLHLSTAEKKSQLKAEIQELEATMRSLDATVEEHDQELKRARVQEREAAKAVQALMGERHDRDEAERTAVAALEQQQAPHHAVLLDELNLSKEKLQTMTAQLEEFTTKEQQFQAKMDDYDAQIRVVKGKLASAAAACRSLSDEIDQEQLKLDQGQSERQACVQKMEEDKRRQREVGTILQEKNAVIEKKIEEALKLCPRVENPRDKETVTKELKKTQLKLSSIRSDGLTKAQVAEKLLEVERKYRRTRRALHSIRELIEEVKSTTDKHLKFCKIIQDHIARRVQFNFQATLTARGYSGSMDIDNGNCVLEMKCTGRESSAKRHAASTSSLSGGERSYSTVAFLMALWDCVELPFYFMDEFDVFMDNVNRNLVMEMLQKHALKNANRQFVFLTPQDTSSVKGGERLSIHLMADPRP